MVLLLKEFHNLKLDLVSRFSVRRYVEEPRFVTLTLYHASPSDLLHQREPKKVAVQIGLRRSSLKVGRKRSQDRATQDGAEVFASNTADPRIIMNAGLAGGSASLFL